MLLELIHIIHTVFLFINLLKTECTLFPCHFFLFFAKAEHLLFSLEQYNPTINKVNREWCGGLEVKMLPCHSEV